MNNRFGRAGLAPLLTLAAFSAGSVQAETVGGAPLIPEPMVFDMIRPLAAPRGELEVNTLALFPIRAQGEEIEWAPEIEYAFANGHAVEFELPFEGGRLESIKLGLQGTLGTLANNRMVHGWQYLGEANADTGRIETTLLYLAGVRFSERWSTLSMVGFNLPNAERAPGERRDDALLVNHSVFNDLSKNTTAGVELNVRAGRDGTAWRLTPQLHQRLSHSIMLQAGVGAKKPAHRSPFATSAVRLIKEF